MKYIREDYEESLNYLTSNCNLQGIGASTVGEISKSKATNCINNLIKEYFELVEHTTPKKPIHIKSINEYQCPVCGYIVLTCCTKMNCCENCGQKLDWSEVLDDE